MGNTFGDLWGRGALIQLALTDLDDTLIAFGLPSATRRSRDAIHALLAEGLHFGPVTGRLPVDMGWMFDGDEPCYATGAFCNGQIVRVDGEVVHTVTIAADALERVERTLDGFDSDAYLALYHPWVAGGTAYVTERPDRLLANPPETYRRSIERIVARVTDFDSSAEPGGERSYVKANVQCACPRERMVELRDLLRREVPDLDFVFPSAVAPVIDIMPGGWNKGNGVRTLAEALGLAPDEYVVFGDSENDLAMIEAVENSVAVSNAADAVARAARWHIGACADGAVDDALTEIAAAWREGRLPSFMGGEGA